MSSIAVEKLFSLSIGLLSVLQLTECEKVQLVGPSRCAGRVEVYHRDRWGTVCDDHWSMANANVVCRELNCGSALESKKSAFFGEGKEEIWLDDVQCTGSEASILKCPHRPLGENNCGHSEDAGVICSEHVRVLNGSSRCNGRVELSHGGHWRRVCSSDWGKAEAQVVCRELDCGTPAANPEPMYFGEADGLSGVKTKCSGNESSLSQCQLHDFKEGCIDASVSCTTGKPIRLVNGTHRCSGRVEVLHEGQWGTVCDDRWGIQEATVACREMNCGTALAVKHRAYFGRGSDQLWLDDIDCTGHEKSLAECPHNGFGDHDCDHSEDAGIVCSETTRLINGTQRCTGRLEVFHNGFWGKVCDTNWSTKDAAMVCKELSCGSPSKSTEILDFGERIGQRGYISTCTGNVSSLAHCAFQETSGSCKGVMISCAGSPTIRLANGTNRCSGRVEVMHDGHWGTVCDDEWDIQDAQVVCRSVDCGTAITAKSGAFFGEGPGEILLDNVECFGNESSLIHCRRSGWGENNCGHSEDAGVVCSDTMRLINGTGQCSGRLEVYHGGRWLPVYNLNWGTNEATVVCREMNCGDPVKVSTSFGQGGELNGCKISCNGRERSIAQCTQREYTRTDHDHVEEASVVCSGDVKLVDGHNPCEGRVEFHNHGEWGSVCGEFWDMNDANVVCRQLNCGRVHKITSETEFGHSSPRTWIQQIECSGSESSLSQCPQHPLVGRNCNASLVAGVICTDSLPVRLVDSHDCSGRIEVRHGQTWQTVCDADWTQSKAEVVCQLLECGHALNAPGSAHFGQGTGPVVEASASCFANHSSLQQCSKNGFPRGTCGHENDASVICAAQIRLMDGSSQCSGRVEVLHQSLWGTVCDDEWELPNADVVCRQLGCGHAVAAPTSAHFGRGTGPIWLDNVQCNGQEEGLTHCTHPKFGENNCGHGEDAGVICLGGLHKPQITVSPGPELNWGDRVEFTCTVVTEHLGGTFILKNTQGSFKMEKYSENEATTFTFPKVDFDQKGSYFCEYQKKIASQVIHFPQGDPADITIKVVMEQPRISLTSPHAMVIFSPDKVSVNQGNSFSITCSIHSLYADGSFYLTESKTNTTDVKLAFGHSIFYLSNFEFPAIEFKHQGEYSCTYKVNISSTTFSSRPSKPLQVSVVAASSSSVVSGVVSALAVLIVLLVIGYLVWRRRGRRAGTTVQFNTRFGGTIKPDLDDKGNGALDGGDRSTQTIEQAQSRTQEDKMADCDNSVEGVPEDLAGRVCYELEPLVHS